jgi:hypothetical protein
MLNFLGNLAEPLGRLATGGAQALGPLRSVPGLRDMIPITATSPLDLFDYNQYKRLGAQYKGQGNYFAGRSLDIAPDGRMSMTAPDPTLGRRRTIGAGLTAGLFGASALGIDPYGMTSTATNVGTFGAHAIMGSALYRAGGKGKLLGTAYLGLLGWNTLKPGDNTGPM